MVRRVLKKIIKKETYFQFFWCFVLFCFFFQFLSTILYALLWCSLCCQLNALTVCLRLCSFQMLGIIVRSHIFPQIKFCSTYSTCIQMNIHVLLQLLIIWEYLKADLAYSLSS